MSLEIRIDFFFFLSFYLFIPERHREAETQAEGEAGSIREPDADRIPGLHPGP